MAAPTVHTSSAGPPKGSEGALHVTAMGPDLFVTTPLPPAGTITIGRDEDADVRVMDESASRLHARLHVGAGAQLFIEDLGTKNGTFLRESRIAPNERVSFQPGEAINIGFTIVMVQRRRVAAQTRRLRSHAGFEERLQEACDRAALSGATFAVARLKIEDEDPSAQAADHLAPALRPGDLLALYAPGDYEALFPDTDGARARALTDELARRLRTHGLGATSAVAYFPADGRTPDALIGHLNMAFRGADGAADGEPVIKSEGMRKVYKIAERAASGQTADGLINTLILGETGVGKDVLAKWIHRKSPRAKGPYVSVNCGALTETLLESELFGHERGAFTDARVAKEGLLEAAAGGTVFLDEIGDMPTKLQVKLLHAIENRRITRVGAVKERPIDVRFIAATHRDLEAMAAAETFRADLYYRLHGISLLVPPLRERPDEIEPLAKHFLGRTGGGGVKRRVPKLSEEAIEILRSYCWPGNARELRNMLDRALVLCDGPEITAEHLDLEKMRTTRLVPSAPATAPASNGARHGAGPSSTNGAVASYAADAETMPVEDLAGLALTPAEAGERALIVRTLAESGGSQTATAKKLDMARGTLIERMKRYRIPRPRAPARG